MSFDSQPQIHIWQRALNGSKDQIIAKNIQTCNRYMVTIQCVADGMHHHALKNVAVVKEKQSPKTFSKIASESSLSWLTIHTDLRKELNF